MGPLLFPVLLSRETHYVLRDLSVSGCLRILVFVRGVKGLFTSLTVGSPLVVVTIVKRMEGNLEQRLPGFQRTHL